MSETLTIRPFQQADTGPVLDLLKMSLGESKLLQRTPELFRWKHLENPFGRSIMLVAADRSLIVGFRAFMRWELELPGGELLRCARPVDTATHPDYRRVGVFRRLTEQAVAMAIGDGVELIFNTPNPLSGAGYRSMGWHQIGHMPVLIRPSLRLMVPRPNPPSDDEAGPMPEAVDRTRSVDSPARGLRTPNRSDYLDWRFRSHPTARYVSAQDDDGHAILRLNLRDGRRETVMSHLAGEFPRRAVARAIRDYRSEYLVASFPKDSPERNSAVRAGLLPLPFKKGPCLYARPLVDIPINIKLMSSWDFAFGDVELL